MVPARRREPPVAAPPRRAPIHFALRIATPSNERSSTDPGRRCAGIRDPPRRPPAPAPRQGARSVRARCRAHADRRDRPAVGVRRRAAGPDPGQGPRADAHLGVLVPPHRLDRRQSPGRHAARALHRRPGRAPPAQGPLDGGAPVARPAGRGGRARLPDRLGLEGLRARRHGLRHRAAQRIAARRPPAGADLHAVHQGARRRTRSMPSPPSTHSRAASSLPTRNSSSASTRTSGSC